MSFAPRTQTALLRFFFPEFATFLAAPKSPAQPIIVDLPSLKDDTSYEDPAGLLSKGSGYYMFAGQSSHAFNSIRWGVIKFDVAATIPCGAVILDAGLTMNRSRTSFDPTTIELPRILLDWGEGTSDATGEEGGGAPPACAVEADVNSDGTFSNIMDLNFLVDGIFRCGMGPGLC